MIAMAILEKKIFLSKVESKSRNSINVPAVYTKNLRKKSIISSHPPQCWWSDNKQSKGITVIHHLCYYSTKEINKIRFELNSFIASVAMRTSQLFRYTAWVRIDLFLLER
jgi:hypothetical protein